MNDVSMQMPKIGVYPDGSPVVCNPEKVAEKRAEIAEKLAEKCKAEGKNPPTTISFAPELERTPNIDCFGPTSENSEMYMLGASIPKPIQDATIEMLADFIKKYGPAALLYIISKGADAITQKMPSENTPKPQEVAQDDGKAKEEPKECETI